MLGGAVLIRQHVDNERQVGGHIHAGAESADGHADEKRCRYRRDRHADTKNTGDQAALNGRDLVWQHRHLGGEQCIEEQLGYAPSDEDQLDVRCQRDNEDAEGTRPPGR